MAKVNPKTSSVKKSSAKEISIPQNIPFWQNDKLMAWLFFGFAFLLYAQTINFKFALDDVAVVQENEFVHKGFAGIPEILKTFYWAGYPGFAMANSGIFRPVSLILFSIEWNVFPDSPHAFHFVNVLLYAWCSFLLYKTLRGIFREYSFTIPILATLLWIVFPAHTEVVANVKSADEILSMIFFLLMTRQLLKWTENKMMKPLLLSGLFFFLSLLSKEGAILFLPISFMTIYLFRKIEVKEFVKPAVVLISTVGIWLAYHAAVIANAPTEKITYDYHHNSLFATESTVSRIATAIEMQGQYLWKSLTGFPLSYDYSYNQVPNTTFADPYVLLSLIVCLGLFVFAILKFKKYPVLAFGILFYFAMFAMTSNIFMLIGATMADRFLFAPSLGFSIALAWGILKLTKGDPEISSVKYFHSKALYILLPLTLIYGFRSYSRSQDWKDDPVLFLADVETATGSGRTHSNVGIGYMTDAFEEKDEMKKRQLLDFAYGEFSIAEKIDSLDYKSQYCLGQVEYNRKNYEASAAWSRKNIATFRYLKSPPNDLGIYKNLGDAYMMMGKYDSARSAFTDGMNADTNEVTFYIKIGNSYLAAKDTMQAIAAYEKAVKVNPKSITGWDKVANVCGMSGNYVRSNEAFLELTKLDPTNPHYYHVMSVNYGLLKDSISSRKYGEEYLRRGGK